jgi:tellurite resistance protein
VGVTLLIPELPQCSPFELASAVRRTIADGPRTSPARALEGQLPSSEALREAGEQLVDADAANARALALLEAPYLVASADGLDAEERQALSALISHLVGSAPPERVCDVLDWLDERLAEDGLQARMERVAASFETRAEREQVLGFAALLALADRHLELEEQNALLRLGDVLGFRQAEVQMLVHKISLRLERAMAVSLRPQPPEEDRDTPPPDTPPAGSGTGTPPTERSG